MAKALQTPMKVLAPIKVLIARIPEPVHTELRKRAFIRNISMSNYVFQAIMEKLIKERQYD